MPLDVQPLSRARRALLLAVIVGLLGGSLGFAQLLVVRRRAQPLVALNLNALGFTTAEPQESIDELAVRSGAVDGHRRKVRVFSYALDMAPTIQAQVDAAEELFQQVSDTTPEETAVSTLAGVHAIQVAGVSSDGNFTMLRFTTVGGRAVAICYSGATPYTDADKRMFSTVCSNGIHLHR